MARSGWGRSVTWSTIAEAKAAGLKGGGEYGGDKFTIYQTARGRFSLRKGHRVIMTLPRTASAE